MPSKKPSKPRRVVKRRGPCLKSLGGTRGRNKHSGKQLPDTSRIPWFPPKSKTATNS